MASPGPSQNTTASQLATLVTRPRIIDVREPGELAGELGHMPGAELLAYVDSALPVERE